VTGDHGPVPGPAVQAAADPQLGTWRGRRDHGGPSTFSRAAAGIAASAVLASATLASAVLAQRDPGVHGGLGVAGPAQDLAQAVGEVTFHVEVAADVGRGPGRARPGAQHAAQRVRLI